MTSCTGDVPSGAGVPVGEAFPSAVVRVPLLGHVESPWSSEGPHFILRGEAMVLRPQVSCLCYIFKVQYLVRVQCAFPGHREES